MGELPLLGTVIGACLGGAYVFYETDRDRKREQAGHVRVPEDRLRLTFVGGILFPVSMFWFAWTGEFNSVHWIVPTIAGVFLSAAITLVFVGYLNYITETYLMYAASALAANTVCRSAAAASGPLFTSYMFDSLGVGGGGSLIAGIAVLLVPVPFVFYKYGGAIRRRSKFAPTGFPPQAAPPPPADSQRSQASTDKPEEQALDEEMGLPRPDSSGDKSHEEKERAPSQGGKGDPFIDADGAEKAEVHHS